MKSFCHSSLFFCLLPLMDDNKKKFIFSKRKTFFFLFSVIKNIHNSCEIWAECKNYVECLFSLLFFVQEKNFINNTSKEERQNGKIFNLIFLARHLFIHVRVIKISSQKITRKAKWIFYVWNFFFIFYILWVTVKFYYDWVFFLLLWETIMSWNIKLCNQI